jgi:hypothetical protein
VKNDDYGLFIELRARAIVLALNIKLLLMTLFQAVEAEKKNSGESELTAGGWRAVKVLA